jgi:type IV fimbrial biogenesis protein FimT
MRHIRGFSLIETLVVVAILVIIVLFAHNNMSHWRKSQNANRVVSEIIHLVHFSRAYAINAKSPITLCGSNDAQHCTHDWAIGMLLFEDRNRNGIIESNDKLIQTIPLNTHSLLTWKGFGGKRITFENSGITAASNGTFTYCELDKAPLYSRQVIVSRGGRARPSQDKNDDGFHDDVNGNTINCPN